MGWETCFNWTNKKDVVQDLSNSIQKSGWKILAEKGTNEGVWYAVEASEKRFIYFGLIKKSRGEYALKTLSEDMGPFYYSCPTKFFDLVPEGNEEWRNTVRTLHEKKKRKVVLTERMKIKLYDNLYTVAHIYKLGKGTNYIITNENGQRFRLKRTQLKDIEVIGE